MNYAQMKQEYIRGWRTWNVRSVLSHVHMPDGLAINLAFKEYSAGRYLKETLIGRFGESDEKCFPGMHTFDDSYTGMTIQWRGMEICVESTVDDDELVLLVTPKTFQIKPAMLVIETGYLWGRKGYTLREGDRIDAHGPDCVRRIYCSGTPADDANVATQSAFLAVSLEGPTAISTGKEIGAEAAQRLLAERRAAAEARSAGYGELAGLYQAMECALAWDTIYDAKNDRVISPVSRLWSLDNGGYVLFCWDNFFAGFMGSLGCRELAYSNLREMLREGDKAGFVPNYACDTGKSKIPYTDSKRACRMQALFVLSYPL